MKLYEFEAFPNPRRVRVFLAEKGIEVDKEQVDVPSGAHRTEAFRAINSDATVPCLALDDGTTISQCVPISRYFEAKHPEPPLMGKTPSEQAEVAMWQRRVEEGLMNAATTYYHHATPGLGKLEPFQIKEWGEKNRERVFATMELLDKTLADRNYVAGDDYSIADITTLCALDFANYAGMQTPDSCKNLKRWHANVSARPSASA